MAIYEYSCPVCGTFETFQKISEEPLKTCPECAKNGVESKVEGLISAPAFHLKGSGWYKTDYPSSSNGAPNGAPKKKAEAKESAPADNKPAEKSSSSTD